MKQCEKCFTEHDGSYGIGRFCCQKCARSFSSAAKRQEINAKVSLKLKGRKKTKEENVALCICEFCEKGYQLKGIKYHIHYCKDNPDHKTKQQTAAWYHAMSLRVGHCDNQYAKFNWDAVPIEKMGHKKRREILYKRANFACVQCGYSKTREDGKTVLEIHHVDGNHLNNIEDNLQVLCPNCHALTANYKNYSRKFGQRTSTRHYRVKHKL